MKPRRSDVTAGGGGGGGGGGEVRSSGAAVADVVQLPRPRHNLGLYGARGISSSPALPSESAYVGTRAQLQPPSRQTSPPGAAGPGAGSPVSLSKPPSPLPRSIQACATPGTFVVGVPDCKVLHAAAEESGTLLLDHVPSRSPARAVWKSPAALALESPRSAARNGSGSGSGGLIGIAHAAGGGGGSPALMGSASSQSAALATTSSSSLTFAARFQHVNGCIFVCATPVPSSLSCSAPATPYCSAHSADEFAHAALLPGCGGGDDQQPPPGPPTMPRGATPAVVHADCHAALHQGSPGPPRAPSSLGTPSLGSFGAGGETGSASDDAACAEGAAPTAPARAEEIVIVVGADCNNGSGPCLGPAAASSSPECSIETIRNMWRGTPGAIKSRRRRERAAAASASLHHAAGEVEEAGSGSATAFGPDGFECVEGQEY